MEASNLVIGGQESFTKSPAVNNFRTEDAQLVRSRYRTSSDIQLWSVTDPVVQLLTDRTP